MVSVAVGAPEVAFADLIAPMAPEPFVPDVSTPEKLTTEIEDVVDREVRAVTVTLESGADANARQISEVPRWTFVLTTNCHVKPAPVTLVTLVFVPMVLVLPAETNAEAAGCLRWSRGARRDGRGSRRRLIAPGGCFDRWGRRGSRGCNGLSTLVGKRL